MGNIETIARAWAESSSPPDPNNSSSKSSKTWAGEAEQSKNKVEEWAQSDGLPGGVGTLSAAGWAGSAALSATAAGLDALAAFGYAGAAGTSETNAGTSAFDANNYSDDAARYRDTAKDLKQLGLPPDPNDKDSKS